MSNRPKVSRCGNLRLFPQWSLEFPPEEEALYKVAIDERVRVPYLVMCILGMVYLVAMYTPLYYAEYCRAGDAFQWARADPRTLLFSTWSLLMVHLLLLVFLLLQSLRRRIRLMNWEAIATGSIQFHIGCTFLMTTWHTARFYKKDPFQVWAGWVPELILTTEHTAVLFQILIVTASCFALPIRVSRLWTLPIVVFASYGSAVIFAGSPFPLNTSRMAVVMFFIYVYIYHGARVAERHSRDKWKAERRAAQTDTCLKDSESLNRAMRAVAGTLCDVVLKLDERLRVHGCDCTLNAYFGQAMEGERLEDRVSLADRGRFHELFKRALETHELESTPLMLELNGRLVRAQLAVITADCHDTRFLVGCRLEDSAVFAVSAEFQVDSVSSDSPSLRKMRDESGSRGSRLDLVGHTRSISSQDAGTTQSACVFEDINHLCYGLRRGPQGLRECLRNVLELGAREHWLIPAGSLELLPDYVLGTGSFGVVVVGRLYGTAVAVKVPVAVNLLADTSKLSTMVNELRTLRLVRHPNTALLLGACIDLQTCQLALVMELVKGCQLGELVSIPPKFPGPSGRRELLLGICRALRYLHSQQPPIVHGDLKPQNVLVQRPGLNVKLADFGLSRILTGNGRPLGGTPRWMAPEVVRGAMPSCAADVFSFGHLLHFVTTGRAPAEDMGEEEVFSQVKQGQQVKLSWALRAQNVLEALGKLLAEECVHPEPGLRPRMVYLHGQVLAWKMEDFTGETLDPDLQPFSDSVDSWDNALRRLRHGVQSKDGTEDWKLWKEPDPAAPDFGPTSTEEAWAQELAKGWRGAPTNAAAPPWPRQALGASRLLSVVAATAAPSSSATHIAAPLPPGQAAQHPLAHPANPAPAAPSAQPCPEQPGQRLSSHPGALALEPTPEERLPPQHIPLGAPMLEAAPPERPPPEPRRAHRSPAVRL